MVYKVHIHSCERIYTNVYECELLVAGVWVYKWKTDPTKPRDYPTRAEHDPEGQTGILLQRQPIAKTYFNPGLQNPFDQSYYLQKY